MIFYIMFYFRMSDNNLELDFSTDVHDIRISSFLQTPSGPKYMFSLRVNTLTVELFKALFAVVIFQGRS